LFERQELQDAQVHARMKAQSALVRPDGAVHLDSEPAVHLHLPVIVEPRHAEHQHTLRFNHPFQDSRFLVFGVLLESGN
jgi:hypothetical protein